MRRFIRLFGLTGAVAFLLPTVAYAWPVYFGAAHSPLLDAARLGVLVMVGVTVTVLGLFARWFLKLRRLEAAEVTEQRHTER